MASLILNDVVRRDILKLVDTRTIGNLRAARRRLHAECRFEFFASVSEEGIPILLMSACHGSVADDTLSWFAHKGTLNKKWPTSLRTPGGDAVPEDVKTDWEADESLAFLPNELSLYHDNNPIHIAFSRGDIAFAQRLLDASKAGQVEALDLSSWTRFCHACIGRDNEKMLSKRLHDEASWDKKLTPVHMAVCWNQPAALMWLLDHGAAPVGDLGPSSADSLGYWNLTVLHEMSRVQHEDRRFLDLVQPLVHHYKVDIHARSSDGVTALALAVEHCQVLLALELIAHGASAHDAHPRFPGQTLLQVLMTAAASLPRADVMLRPADQDLVDRNERVMARNLQSLPALIQALLDRGVNPRNQTATYGTALHAAMPLVWSKFGNVIDTLLRTSTPTGLTAEACPRDSSGATPLCLALSEHVSPFAGARPFWPPARPGGPAPRSPQLPPYPLPPLISRLVHETNAAGRLLQSAPSTVAGFDVPNVVLPRIPLANDVDGTRIPSFPTSAIRCGTGPCWRPGCVFVLEPKRRGSGYKLVARQPDGHPLLGLRPNLLIAHRAEETILFQSDLADNKVIIRTAGRTSRKRSRRTANASTERISE